MPFTSADLHREMQRLTLDEAARLLPMVEGAEVWRVESTATGQVLAHFTTEAAARTYMGGKPDLWCDPLPLFSSAAEAEAFEAEMRAGL